MSNPVVGPRVFAENREVAGFLRVGLEAELAENLVELPRRLLAVVRGIYEAGKRPLPQLRLSPRYRSSCC
jgi:hypothetical protein